MFDISDKDFLKLFNKVDLPSGGALVSNYNLDIFKKDYSCEKGRNSEYDNRTPFSVNNQTHFNNEVKYLRLLEKYNITPKIIDSRDNEIILTGCGEKLSQQNLPNNWKEQIHNIYEILKKENIFHNDIKYDNFTVNHNKIYLIDFGWSSENFPGFPFLNIKYDIINNSENFNDFLNKIYNEASSIILNAGIKLNTYLNKDVRNEFLKT